MDMNPDPESSIDLKVFVERLSNAENESIDLELLGLCGVDHRKVAKTVGAFLQENPTPRKNLPVLFLASRVYELDNFGELEFQGYIGYMRYCEVRLKAN